MGVSFEGAIVSYTREINPVEIAQSIHKSVTHQIKSYSSIQRVLENSLEPFDPFLEITPNSIDLLDEGLCQWDGKFTISTRMNYLDVVRAVSHIFELSEFEPLRDQRIQNCYSLVFDEGTDLEIKDDARSSHFSHKVSLKGCSLGSLEADIQIRLPIKPKSQEKALAARAPLPKPEHPNFEVLAADLAKRQANIDKVQELTTQYLIAVGSMTTELGEYLNQANWHDILRSMGYVAGGAGFAALGIGGFLGPVLEGVAFIARATGATVTAYDTAHSEDAQQFAAEVKQALELKLAECCQASASNPPEITDDLRAEEIESSEALEDDWVVISARSEELTRNRDDPIASEDTIE